MIGTGGVFNSGLGQQLGWVLLHSIWEGALGAALFGIVRVSMRRCTANTRYLAACLMLMMLATAPIITMVWMSSSNRSVFGPNTVLAGNTIRHASDSGPKVSTFTSTALPSPASFPRVTELFQPAIPWLVQLWAGGVIALSFRWYAGTRWVRRVKNLETCSPGREWVVRLHQLSVRLGVTRPVKLFKSALVEVPMVVGWLRPVILLPASAIAGLTTRQLEAILAHELAHVLRYDYLVNTFQNAVETLMFYHPAVWWVSKCIREEREHCCDDLVVRVCGDRLSYVRALVTLEEGRDFSRLAFAATGGSLLHRVRRLLGGAPDDYPTSAAEFSGISLVAIGCVCIVASFLLLTSSALYQASALIKVNPLLGLQFSAGDAQNPMGNYYPYFLQTECLVIRSPAVLQMAIRSLGLNQNGGTVGRDPKTVDSDAVSRLRARLNLRLVPNSSVIEIQATDPEPAQAARIANVVATAYKEHRLEQRSSSLRSLLDSLEGRFADQEQRIRKAQQLVDRLRLDLKIPDQVVSENNPTVTLSAETLRHVEALRIESQAECVKQKVLLDRLTQLDTKDLPASMLAIGVQDNQLAELSQSLALVDQRLVSLQKELGPENVEILKFSAQQEDLRQKIKVRTGGILMGLQAKFESAEMGLVSLSNAVVSAQASDLETANRSRPYFEAKRDLDDLVQFRQILQTKIAMEKTDQQLSVDNPEIVEEALVPTQAIASNRSRGFVLLATGLVLAMVGWGVARAGRPMEMRATAA